MAHGLPAVGFDNASGVNSLIQHNLTGYLADGENRVDSFVYYLDKLMASEKLRESMGKAGMRFVKQYHPDLVYDQWEKMFAKMRSIE